jgi:hypothetical protein
VTVTFHSPPALTPRVGDERRGARPGDPGVLNMALGLGEEGSSRGCEDRMQCLRAGGDFASLTHVGSAGESPKVTAEVAVRLQGFLLALPVHCQPQKYLHRVLQTLGDCGSQRPWASRAPPPCSPSVPLLHPC